MRPKTRSLAKALAAALPSHDGSPAPVRVLRMVIANPRPSDSDYAYARVTFNVCLVSHDGADGESNCYKARRPDGGTQWDNWPHAPETGHDDVAFRFSFDAKDPQSHPLRPEVHLTGYEPTLSAAASAVAFAERIMATLAKLDESQGNVASFPEAISRLMAATEATAIATHQRDFETLTNKSAPAWRSHCIYRLASSVPDARHMVEDTESAIRESHARKLSESDREGNDSDARA